MIYLGTMQAPPVSDNHHFPSDIVLMAYCWRDYTYSNTVGRFGWYIVGLLVWEPVNTDRNLLLSVFMRTVNFQAVLQSILYLGTFKTNPISSSHCLPGKMVVVENLWEASTYGDEVVILCWLIFRVEIWSPRRSASHFFPRVVVYAESFGVALWYMLQLRTMQVFMSHVELYVQWQCVHNPSTSTKAYNVVCLLLYCKCGRPKFH